ncbi:MAG TPA: M56 family metallopeptidase [Puia sp.]|nr:M56 family metallopeptidase [Puia sp.]
MHLLTQSALLEALGWSLLNSLWQMGLLWFLYKVLVFLFPAISARTRHGLIILSLAAGTFWSVWSLVSGFVPASTGAAGILLVPAPVRSFIANILPYGSSLYLLILAGLLVRYCYHYFYSIRLTREGLSGIEPGYRVFVAETSRLMGIRPAVKVWLSKRIDVPVTLGFLKPVILLPFAMAGQLTTEQVEAILVHELAHIRRNDFLLNLGVTLLEGLFFFNPFARWFIADLKKEREYCCDDLVLQFRYDPQTYVSALLAVARQASQDRQARLVVAATGNGSDQLLLQRARRLLQQQRTEERPGARPFAILFLTALITLVSLSRPARTRPEAARSLSPGMPVTVVRLGVPAAEVKPGMPVTAVRLGMPAAGVKPDRPLTQAPSAEGQSAPLVSNTAPSQPVSRSIHPSHPAHLPDNPEQPEYDELDEAPLALVTAVADADPVRPEELVAVIPKDNREYSIGKSRSVTRTPVKEEGQPFVPKSSFSFLSIDEDTLHPEDKLARVQIQTQREIAQSMQKLQLDLMAQLQLVKTRQKQLQEYNLPDDIQDLKEQQALIEEQIRVQRAYIQKLDELQKKLKKAQHRLTIVYI